MPGSWRLWWFVDGKGDAIVAVNKALAEGGNSKVSNCCDAEKSEVYTSHFTSNINVSMPQDILAFAGIMEKTM